MNFSLLSGIGCALVMLWLGVFRSLNNPSFYFDSHAMIIVFGGTVAAALIAFPFSQLMGLSDTFMTWLTRSKVPDYAIVEEMYDLAVKHEKYKDLTSSLEFNHSFINESLVFLDSSVFDLYRTQEILTKRILSFRKKAQNDGKILSVISKFPPAFGLLGASTGMISMMINLTDGGTKIIGNAMAIALVATFWGIALANLIFLPLSDLAQKIAQEDSHTRQIIMEGILLIKQNEHPEVIVETLKSQLVPKDRLKVKIPLAVVETQTPNAITG